MPLTIFWLSFAPRYSSSRLQVLLVTYRTIMMSRICGSLSKVRMVIASMARDRYAGAAMRSSTVAVTTKNSRITAVRWLAK